MSPGETLAAVATAGQLVAGHGFAAGEQHHEAVIDVAGPAPDGDATVQLGTVTLVFTHCVEVRSAARPEAVSDDGMIAAVAEDAFSLVAPSEAARHWTELLGRPMHEALLRTSAYTLRLVFADVEVIAAPSQSDWVGGAQS